MAVDSKKTSEQMFGEYDKIFSEIYAEAEKLDKTKLSRPEYEKKYQETKQKMVSYKSSIERFKTMNLDSDLAEKRKELITKLKTLILQFNKLNPKNFPKKDAKEIEVSPKSGFSDIGMTVDQIRSIKLEQFIAYTAKGFEYYTTDIAGVKYILRINRNKNGNELALCNLNEDNDNIDGLVSKIQGDEMVRNFQDIELKGGRSLMTLGMTPDFTTKDAQKIGLTNKMDFIKSWTNKDSIKK